MPVIEVSREIHADVDTVYRLAKEVEDFPSYMPDVKSLTVLERSDDGRRTVTEWVGVVEQFHQTVRWVEEDLWNDAEHTCQFKQLRGDYSKYGGVWRFVPTDGGTRFESTLEFEYNIPLIGPLIQGIIVRLMRSNLENTLRAIGEQAEAAFRSNPGMSASDESPGNEPTSDPHSEVIPREVPGE